MKCPLLIIAYHQMRESADYAEQNCLQAECAWWSPKREDCCIRSIAQDLYYIESHLREVGKHD